MTNNQRKTYLVYSRGMMPDELRLGGLYADPANPLDGEYKRFECPLSFEDMQENWLGQPELEAPLNINVEVSRGWLINAGISTVLGGRARRHYSEQIMVSGARGRRLKIQRPETFLNEVILSSPKAREWLKQQLSITRRMYYTRKLRWGEESCPLIWLLTGIQYIDNARVIRADDGSKNAAFVVRTPTNLPVASVASMITGQQSFNINLEGEASKSWRASVDYYHEDERVWAAQFYPLKVKFSIAGKGADSEFPKGIRLLPPPDYGSSGIRGDDSSEIIDLMVQEVAEIEGLDESSTDDWDENPSSLLRGMQEVDWHGMEEFGNEMAIPSEAI